VRNSQVGVCPHGTALVRQGQSVPCGQAPAGLGQVSTVSVDQGDVGPGIPHSGDNLDTVVTCTWITEEPVEPGTGEPSKEAGPEKSKPKAACGVVEPYQPPARAFISAVTFLTWSFLCGTRVAEGVCLPGQAPSASTAVILRVETSLWACNNLQVVAESQHTFCVCDTSARNKIFEGLTIV
jgi:hypothetical protein